MNTPGFSVNRATRYLPYIVLVGIGIGTANFTVNGSLNWIQWSIQSVVTSFIIGYSLVVIGTNRQWFQYRIKNVLSRHFLLTCLFFLLGVLATEVEHVIRSVVFQTETFAPFSSFKMHLFNGIISLILGFSFFTGYYRYKDKDLITEHEEGSKLSEDIVHKVPVKQGESILLIPLSELVYLEAYDNYAFVITQNGEKKLCDYSLGFLEKRLPDNFSRVHRKYIVNQDHIKDIRPHLNGRYMIRFLQQVEPITSSKSYLSTIKSMIKID